MSRHPALHTLLAISEGDCPKVNFNNYVKGPQLKSCLHDLLGDGIFNADGTTWKAQRKVGARIMTTANLKNLVTSVVMKQTTHLIERLDRASAEGLRVDLQAEFFNFTMTAFLQMAFSTDLEALSASLRDKRKREAGLGAANQQQGRREMSFAEAFDTAQRLSVNRLSNPAWKFTRRWNANEKMLQQSLSILDEVSRPKT